MVFPYDNGPYRVAAAHPLWPGTILFLTRRRPQIVVILETIPQWAGSWEIVFSGTTPPLWSIACWGVIIVRPPVRTCKLSEHEPADSLVHSESAPDHRVMLIQRRGSKGFWPRFGWLVFVPQFFDSRKPRFAIATIRLICSAFSHSIRGCNSAMNCFAARSAGLSIL